MKVLYVHQFFTTPAGTTGTRSYEMARALIARGHQVTILCATHHAGGSGLQGPFIGGSRRGTIDGIDIIEIETSYKHAMGVAARARAFAKFASKCVSVAQREPYSILFATSAPLTAALPALWMKIIRRDCRPFVFEIRDPWPEVPRAMGLRNPILLWGLEALETLAYKNASGWIALSPGMVSSFSRKGVPQERIAMIPNGSDLQMFAPCSEKGISIEGITPNDFVFVFSGAHGLANGLRQVVEACRVLQDRHATNIKVWLVGQGKEKPELVALAHSFGLTNIVFSDPIPKHLLSKLLPKTNCGLMILADVPVFRYGSSPNKFFDYISAGLPVIVNHPGWVADLITTHGCGLQAKPGDPTSLASMMISIAASGDADRMGNNARNLAESLFDRGILSQRFVDYLEDVHMESPVRDIR